MPDTAESHSHSLPTNRNCVIELTNLTQEYCLCDPQIHMNSGFVFSPPQPTLRSTFSEVCSFVKDDNTARGAAGVLTYKMFDTRNGCGGGKMVVMFSVPFDYGSYQNWLAVGVFPPETECNQKLFDHMYESKDCPDFVRGKADGSGLKHQGKTVDVRGSMSSGGQAIIKLELYDKMNRFDRRY